MVLAIDSVASNDVVGGMTLSVSIELTELKMIRVDDT